LEALRAALMDRVAAAEGTLAAATVVAASEAKERDAALDARVARLADDVTANGAAIRGAAEGAAAAQGATTSVLAGVAAAVESVAIGVGEVREAVRSAATHDDVADVAAAVHAHAATSSAASRETWASSQDTLVAQVEAAAAAVKEEVARRADATDGAVAAVSDTAARNAVALAALREALAGTTAAVKVVEEGVRAHAAESVASVRAALEGHKSTLVNGVREAVRSAATSDEVAAAVAATRDVAAGVAALARARDAAEVAAVAAVRDTERRDAAAADRAAAVAAALETLKGAVVAATTAAVASGDGARDAGARAEAVAPAVTAAILPLLLRLENEVAAQRATLDTVSSAVEGVGALASDTQSKVTAMGASSEGMVGATDRVAAAVAGVPDTLRQVAERLPPLERTMQQLLLRPVGDEELRSQVAALWRDVRDLLERVPEMRDVLLREITGELSPARNVAALHTRLQQVAADGRADQRQVAKDLTLLRAALEANSAALADAEAKRGDVTRDLRRDVSTLHSLLRTVSERVASVVPATVAASGGLASSAVPALGLSATGNRHSHAEHLTATMRAGSETRTLTAGDPRATTGTGAVRRASGPAVMRSPSYASLGRPSSPSVRGLREGDLAPEGALDPAGGGGGGGGGWDDGYGDEDGGVRLAPSTATVATGRLQPRPFPSSSLSARQREAESRHVTRQKAPAAAKQWADAHRAEEELDRAVLASPSGVVLSSASEAGDYLRAATGYAPTAGGMDVRPHDDAGGGGGYAATRDDGVASTPLPPQTASRAGSARRAPASGARGRPLRVPEGLTPRQKELVDRMFAHTIAESTLRGAGYGDDAGAADRPLGPTASYVAAIVGSGGGGGGGGGGGEGGEHMFRNRHLEHSYYRQPDPDAAARASARAADGSASARRRSTEFRESLGAAAAAAVTAAAAAVAGDGAAPASGAGGRSPSAPPGPYRATIIEI